MIGRKRLFVIGGGLEYRKIYFWGWVMKSLFTIKVVVGEREIFFIFISFVLSNSLLVGGGVIVYREIFFCVISM